jgi:hypothetical protein
MSSGIAFCLLSSSILTGRLCTDILAQLWYTTATYGRHCYVSPPCYGVGSAVQNKERLSKVEPVSCPHSQRDGCNYSPAPCRG